jgi:hypothetical protein
LVRYPARFITAFGFRHPRGRGTRVTRSPGEPILVAGSLLGRCVRRCVRGRRVS